jgi:tetratricopeptide (TPR) repeat protein
MEDGSPPPGLATIERVCNGVSHTAGYADTKGAFAIELGNEQGVFQDASDALSSRPIGQSGARSAAAQERLLHNCELRAKLAGYRSQSIILAGRRAMDDPNIGTILLHKEGPSDGTTVSATSLAAPKSAQRLLEKGIDLAKKEKFPDALESFQKALEIYPNYAVAWTELGKVQLVMSRRDEARFAFESALKLDAKFVPPYVELGRMEYDAKRWPELAEITGRSMRLNPFDYPQLFLLNGIAHYYMRETDAAEKSVKEAERLDTQRRFPETAHLHGLILAQRHEFAAACQYLRDYLRMAPDATDLDVVRGQLAMYEKAAPTASVEKH